MAGDGKVTFTLVAENADAIKKIGDFINATEGINSKITNTFKNGHSVVDQFGSKLVTAAMGGATAFAVVEATIGRAISALKEMNAIAEEGARGRLTNEAALRALAQQAPNDSAKLHQLEREAWKTAKEAGIPVSQAAALQLELENAGLGGERATFARLPDIGINPIEMTKSVGAIIDAMKGGDSTGSARQVLNKLMVAAKPIRATPEEVAKGMSMVAPSAKMLGASDEEAMAAVTGGAQALGGVELGATAVRAFGSFAAQEGLGGGKGFMAAVNAVTKMGLNPQDLQNYITEERALRGYLSLRDQAGFVASQQSAISAAQMAPEGADYLSEAQASANERFGKEKAVRVAGIKVAEKVETGPAAARKLGYMASAQETEAAMELNTFERYGGRAMAKSASIFGLSEKQGGLMFATGAQTARDMNILGNLDAMFGKLINALAGNTDATQRNTTSTSAVDN